MSKVLFSIFLQKDLILIGFITSYCNKDSNMKFCSVEIGDSTEQGRLLTLILQYTCQNISFCYIELSELLNMEG